MICLPMGRDQKDNAAKVAYHGCGIRLNPKANIQEIRHAISLMLEDQSFRNKAALLQKEICMEAEKDVAIDELEQLSNMRKESLISIH